MSVSSQHEILEATHDQGSHGTTLMTRRQYYSFRIKETIRILFSIDSIMMNIVALILCGVMLFILDQKEWIPNMGKNHLYLYRAAQLLACLQIFRSATRSLILPVAVILFAGSAIINYTVLHAALPISLSTLREMMLIGIIGMGISIFYLR